MLTAPFPGRGEGGRERKAAAIVTLAVGRVSVRPYAFKGLHQEKP